MKSFLTTLFLTSILFTVISKNVSAQSNPQALKPGITINRILTVHDGAIRVAKDPVSKELYYVLTSGEVYKVIRPTGGAAYDTLMYTVAQHGVEYVQGMAFYDSTLFVSGNNHSTTALTYGIIVRGKLQPNGSRVWDTLMHTDNYQTADYFDHLFSGLVVSPSGDSIYVCSGARGDHGEVQTRYGAYPGLRNVPLTTNIFQLPAKNPVTITLQNDSAWLASSGYVYCRGVRNHFDMAFDATQNLFALENSGDRDHNEEMNWLRRDHHYGFPWRMGDTENPQQYSWFNPAADSLINHFSRSWRNGFWSNDPSFPPPPSGITFDAPIQNFGPDADKFRDSLDNVHDASDSGISIGTFTAHRSPLGLVFDNAQAMGPEYRGHGFMLSWTEGLDSCGCTVPPDTGIGPFVDPSQDMLHLELAYDAGIDNFTLHATRIIADFEHPVDADIDSNMIYVMENGYGGTSGLFEVSMPVAEFPCNPVAGVNYITPCIEDSNFVVLPAFGSLPNYVNWYDVNDSLLRADTVNTTSDTLSYLDPGFYHMIITDGGACGTTDTIAFFIPQLLSMHIDSVIHTSCIGCYDGTIYWHAENGNGPYTYSIDSFGFPFFGGNPIDSLGSRKYVICVTDANGCMACDSVDILEDPTSVHPVLLSDNITLFPNPVSNRFTLRSNNNQKLELKLLNSDGRLIKEVKESQNSAHGQDITVDTSELPEGYYMLEVKSGGNYFYKKLIITR